MHADTNEIINRSSATYHWYHHPVRLEAFYKRLGKNPLQPQNQKMSKRRKDARTSPSRCLMRLRSFMRNVKGTQVSAHMQTSRLSIASQKCPKMKRETGRPTCSRGWPEKSIWIAKIGDALTLEERIRTFLRIEQFCPWYQHVRLRTWSSGARRLERVSMEMEEEKRIFSHGWM